MNSRTIIKGLLIVVALVCYAIASFMVIHGIAGGAFVYALFAGFMAGMVVGESNPKNKTVTWVEFHQDGWVTGQLLPKEKKYLLVQLAEKPEQGLPPIVAVGYMRYAAGDKNSPTFTVPGVGGTVVAWCDCLPENFKAPLWKG
jgi:hypothetical protein